MYTRTDGSKAAILILVMFALAYFLVGCGAEIKQETVYRVEGDATVHVVVGVDVTPCESVAPQDKAQCVQDLIDFANAVAAQKEKQGN